MLPSPRKTRSLLLLLLIASKSQAALVLQACCGEDATSCKEYSRIEDMVGVGCCGVEPMNSFSQLCCQNTIRERKVGTRFAELCCGDQALSYDQTCCDGVVHNVPSGNCCGRAVYDKEERGVLCCNRTLTRANANDICCGSEAFDSGRTQICCGQKVYENSAFDSCCESSTGAFAPFRSETHFCCETPQARSSGKACCYLRVEGSGIKATPYDSKTQCCTYPYKELTTKKGGSCIYD